MGEGPRRRARSRRDRRFDSAPGQGRTRARYSIRGSVSLDSSKVRLEVTANLIALDGMCPSRPSSSSLCVFPPLPSLSKFGPCHPDRFRPSPGSQRFCSLPPGFSACSPRQSASPSQSVGWASCRPSSCLGTLLPGPVEGRSRHRCSERPGVAAAHAAVGPAALAVGHRHPGEIFSATGLAQELQVEFSLVSRCHPPACILVCAEHESSSPFPFFLFSFTEY